MLPAVVCGAHPLQTPQRVGHPVSFLGCTAGLEGWATRLAQFLVERKK